MVPKLNFSKHVRTKVKTAKKVLATPRPVIGRKSKLSPYNKVTILV